MPQPTDGPEADESLFYAVFAANGEPIRIVPESLSIPYTPPAGKPTFQQTGFQRAVHLRGPHHTAIVVGRTIERPLSRLTGLALKLAAAGASVLCLGLLGGWWLSGRAIQPIAHIQHTAARITVTDLHGRIDSSAMDSELQGLAEILNSMWSRLESAFNQQIQFTADASHELRTPVSVILSNCELALDRPRSNEEYQQTIHTCLRAGWRMQTLVNDLLVLARADAGELQLQATDIDLSQLAHEAVAMMQAVAADAKVHLECTGQNVRCYGDATRISQIISNLVANAIAHSPANSSVNITVTTVADW
ncbi:MAG: hypothetical protein KDB23_32965, partial [Planctomycetales bacterium]|nr:hypothetical protein [Planctomycetales bacterium]